MVDEMTREELLAALESANARADKAQGLAEGLISFIAFAMHRDPTLALEVVVANGLDPSVLEETPKGAPDGG